MTKIKGSTDMDHSGFIQKFIALYGGLNKHTLHHLSEIYSSDVQFIDAVHEINGIDELTDYFTHLYTNLIECKFTIHHVIEDINLSQGEAMLFWTMNYKHPKIGKGKSISVEGVSHIKFNDKVFYHRDFLDMGQMVYEHLPLIGPMVKFIKKRVQA
ncbi:nuclear transport factor 2 family protein [Aliivibrio fischeri]|uniref:nuclear transport factor 2 family protein n=1 Tax=Aliivibrio fischeri TaxID=668 RepID=UPI003D318DE8